MREEKEINQGEGGRDCGTEEEVWSRPYVSRVCGATFISRDLNASLLPRFSLTLSSSLSLSRIALEEQDEHIVECLSELITPSSSSFYSRLSNWRHSPFTSFSLSLSPIQGGLFPDVCGSQGLGRSWTSRLQKRTCESWNSNSNFIITC